MPLFFIYNWTLISDVGIRCRRVLVCSSSVKVEITYRCSSATDCDAVIRALQVSLRKFGGAREGLIAFTIVCRTGTHNSNSMRWYSCARRGIYVWGVENELYLSINRATIYSRVVQIMYGSNFCHIGGTGNADIVLLPRSLIPAIALAVSYILLLLNDH